MRWLRGIVRMLIGGGILFAALEIGFRAMPHLLPLAACKASNMLAVVFCQPYYRYDDPPRLGYTFTPGYTYDGPWNPGDPAVVGAESETCAPAREQTFRRTFRVDDKGFVNPMPWRDQYDIVLTGDSFVNPFSAAYWVDMLREQTEMSVLNLGVTGWGTLSEVEAVQMYGLDKAPRWVILAYYEGNDLFNVEEYQRRRQAGLSWPAYEIQQVSFPERFVTPHVLRALLVPPGYPAVPCRYPMTVYTNTGHFEAIFFAPNVVALSRTREEIEASQGWALATEAILALRDDVEAIGARFLLLYIPAKEHLYWSRLWDAKDANNFLALTNPLRSYDVFGQTAEAQVQLMEDFAHTHGVALLNLTGPFWETFAEGAELYYYADTHWNDAGNRVAAEWAASYLRSHQ